jgi:hypothetical protein
MERRQIIFCYFTRPPVDGADFLRGNLTSISISRIDVVRDLASMNDLFTISMLGTYKPSAKDWRTVILSRHLAKARVLQVL